MKFIFDCFTVVIVGDGGDGGEKLPLISCLICKVENMKAVYSISRRMRTLECTFIHIYIHG